MLKLLTHLNDWIYKMFMWAGGILLAIFAISVFIQVIARNYLEMSLPWTTELSLFCFIWGIMLGTAVAVREGRHYIVDFMPARFYRLSRCFDILAAVICFYLYYVMITSGYDYTLLGTRRMSTSLGFAMSWQFISMPIVGVSMVLFGLEKLLIDLSKIKAGF